MLMLVFQRTMVIRHGTSNPLNDEGSGISGVSIEGASYPKRSSVVVARRCLCDRIKKEGPLKEVGAGNNSGCFCLVLVDRNR